MSNIDGQIVNSRMPTQAQDGTGAVLAEVPHQQLNVALAAGTVDEILMKTGYNPSHDYHVVCLKDLRNFIGLGDLATYLSNWSMDCGKYNPLTQQDTVPNLLIKTNSSYASSKKVPSSAELAGEGLGKGEIAIDPFDGTLYVWGDRGNTVVGVNAGTVNGNEVNRPVPASGDTNAWLTRSEIVALINNSFDYNSATNALTIKPSV